MKLIILAAISTVMIAQQPTSVNWCDGVANETLKMRLSGVSMIDAFYRVAKKDEYYVWKAYKIPISELKVRLGKCEESQQGKA